MGVFVSTFIPYDATGRAVNLDTEYMYREDGLRLKVIRFEYYKSDDADCNWFILAPVDSSNAIKVDLYKVSELYIERPSDANVIQAINDLYSLESKLLKLGFNLVYGRGRRSDLCEKANQLALDLRKIINKLENPDVE